MKYVNFLFIMMFFSISIYPQIQWEKIDGPDSFFSPFFVVGDEIIFKEEVYSNTYAKFRYYKTYINQPVKAHYIDFATPFGYRPLISFGNKGKIIGTNIDFAPIKISTDFGESWLELSNINEPPYFDDDDNLILNSKSFSIDNGVTWKQMDNVPENLTGSYIGSLSKGLFTNKYFTFDSGKTWQQYQLPDSLTGYNKFRLIVDSSRRLFYSTKTDIYTAILPYTNWSVIYTVDDSLEICTSGFRLKTDNIGNFYFIVRNIEVNDYYLAKVNINGKFGIVHEKNNHNIKYFDITDEQGLIISPYYKKNGANISDGFYRKKLNESNFEKIKLGLSKISAKTFTIDNNGRKWIGGNGLFVEDIISDNWRQILFNESGVNARQLLSINDFVIVRFEDNINLEKVYKAKITGDGGETWMDITPEGYEIKKILAHVDGRLFCLANNGLTDLSSILVSEDNGKTWINIQQQDPQILFSNFFIHKNGLWAISNNDYYMVSYDDFSIMELPGYYSIKLKSENVTFDGTLTCSNSINAFEFDFINKEWKRIGPTISNFNSPKIEKIEGKYFAISGSSGIQNLNSNMWEDINQGFTATIYSGYNISSLYYDGKLKLYAVSQNTGIYELNIYEITEVEHDEKQVPSNFLLEQNYPNPFNPSTKIKYTIPVVETKHASSTNVKLEIFNTLGQKIKTLVNEPQQAGTYEAEFQANSLPSGVYYYRLQAGQYSETKKMLLLR